MTNHLRNFVLVLGLSSAFALAQVTPQQSPAPTTPATFPASTAVVPAQSQIQNALHKQLPAIADSVTVSSTSDNSIQLSGNVSTDEQKSQAEQIARSVVPEQTIVNKINVSHAVGAAMTPSATGEASVVGQTTAPPSSNSQTGQASNYPSSTSGGQTGAAGQSSTSPSSGAGANSADLQNNIQKALQQDAGLANSNITVNVTNDNKIELSGTVPSEKEKKTAKSIAKANAAGHKVVNKIKVANERSQSTLGGPPRY